MAWWYKVWMTETIHKPLQLRTAWNKAALFSMVFSASWLMPSITARTEYRSDTGLTAACSTSGAWRLLQSEEDRHQRLPICWWLYPQRQHRGNDAAWNTLLTSRLWQLRHYRQHQKHCWSRVSNLRLRGRTYRQLILTSPIWVVHLQLRCTLMLNSTTG